MNRKLSRHMPDDERGKKRRKIAKWTEESLEKDLRKRKRLQKHLIRFLMKQTIVKLLNFRGKGFFNLDLNTEPKNKLFPLLNIFLVLGKKREWDRDGLIKSNGHRLIDGFARSLGTAFDTIKSSIKTSHSRKTPPKRLDLWHAQWLIKCRYHLQRLLALCKLISLCCLLYHETKSFDFTIMNADLDGWRQQPTQLREINQCLPRHHSVHLPFHIFAALKADNLRNPRP